MGHFSFLFVLFMVVVANEAKSIVKRSSLVSRFTSNPFFLSHFSGFQDYYERPTFVSVSVDPDDEESEEDNNSQEEDNNNQEQDPEPVVPIFKILPLYEKTQNFSKIEPKIFIFRDLPHYSRVNNFNKAANFGKLAVTYYFNSLPHFETRHVFREENKEEENGVFFRVLPHFDGAHFKRRKIVKIVRKKKI